MVFDSPNGLNLSREASYNTPFAHSALLLPLMLSVMKQKNSPATNNTFKAEYDYIIVGGGTAGSALASRLSEVECVTVLLLEYGDHPPHVTDVPLAFLPWWYSDIDYAFKTVPQKHTGFALPDNRIQIPAGKVLGGSSVTNGLIYVRGNKLDFQNWTNLGATGWGYEDVLDYFKKSEDNQNPEYAASRYHGKGGPLTVSDMRYFFESYQPILEAASDIGYRIGDANGEIQTGIYPSQFITRDAQRCSAAKAFLVPAENRTNLDIVVNAHVNKIIIENDPLRATGVVFDHGGQTHTVSANREVIISAGTINTPKLLMLSGIGPRKELEKHEIKMLKDLPVGENLMDHPSVFLDFFIDENIPLPIKKLADDNYIQQYIDTRTGPLAASSLISTLAFLKGDEIRPEIDFPNYELYFFQVDVSDYKNIYRYKSEIYDSYFKPNEGKPLLHCLVHQAQPRSRGTVTLKSADSYEDPLIDPNYLSNSDDVGDLLEGMRTCQRIVLSDAVHRNLSSRPYDLVMPGCEKEFGDETAYLKCLIKYFTLSTFHYVGTARMGHPDDPRTVVCPQLKVIDVKGLRVVDASVMPVVTTGNTMAPVLMIAEKAAEMIKNDLFKDIGSCPAA